MRILVTGCGGYIGTTLVPYLLKRGYQVRCVDWLVFGEDLLDHVKGSRGFELVRDDVRRVSPDVLRGVDAVIDMAAIPNDPAGELRPELTVEINYRARARMAEMARELGIPRYILISSASVYGRRAGVVDEDSEPSPLTTYARANLMAEKAVLPLSGRGFTTTALRLSTVYGPSRRMRLDLVVNGMTYSAYSEGLVRVEWDGSQERPLIHVLDVARAVDLFLTAESDLIGGRVFNIGSEDQNYRIIDVADIVRRTVGGEIVFYKGDLDVRSYRLSFSRIRGLGFSPIYKVEDGVRQIYHELLLGHLRADDRWFTLRWYKRLIEGGLVA